MSRAFRLALRLLLASRAGLAFAAGGGPAAPPAAAAAEEGAAPPFSAPAADEQIFGAMRAEMDRSLKGLKIESFGPPYFLAYRLVDDETLSLSASFGALVRRDRDASRTLYVEARYGSPALDNTDLEYQGWRGGAAADPEVLRASLWSLTDTAYKAAVAGYLDKKAKRATELQREILDDFSVEKPVAAALPQPPLAFDWPGLRRLVEGATAEFRRQPFVHGSDATVSLRRARRYLVTSEGTRLATAQESAPVVLYVSVWTQADDGMQLYSQRYWAAAEPKDLPDEADLRREAASLALELRAMQQAPVQGPASGPAIMDPEFTGVFFHEALGHKLEGQRQRDPNESQVFKDRVGSRVLPEFLSVIDDPTLAEFQGKTLHGHYLFDDEGVPAAPLTLVDRGILKEFLMSRWPLKGFERSNGHGRAEKYYHPSGRMSNFMVVAHETEPPGRLKKRLLELCAREGKPYGFILRGSHGGENPTNRRTPQTLEVQPRLVYRVDAATGEETLVRGVKMVGTPLVLLNRIVAAGDDAALSNPFFCGAESGTIPVDQIAPSVLVSELELQRLPEERSRPPILPIPFQSGERR